MKTRRRLSNPFQEICSDDRSGFHGYTSRGC
jgi:hypothetical protein